MRRRSWNNINDMKDREGKTSGGDDGEGLGADGRADHGGREDDGETCGRYQINGGGIYIGMDTEAVGTRDGPE